jgi:GAF domain-containing protein
MAVTNPDSSQDFTASDVLAPHAWTGRPVPGRPQVGVDVTCTKIAVDFLSITAEGAEACIRQGLDLLRTATGCDAAFAIALDDGAPRVASVLVSRGGFSQCQPEALIGESLADWSWLGGRLEHLRLSELRDTAEPRREQQADAQRLALLQIGSALMVAYRIQGRPAGLLGLAQALPRGPWEVNLQLLLKLLGASLATGLARLRLESRCTRVEARTAQRREPRGHLGLRRGKQPDGVLAALARDARLRRRSRRRDA